MINPYMVHVVDMARHHKIVDSLSVYQAPKNELELRAGGDTVETVNAIVPLFDEKIDADLKPLITSKLYHILMTFNVMQNVDTCFENAYLALLSNTFLYLILQPES